MCGKAEKRGKHKLSNCSKLAQREYKTRHGLEQRSIGKYVEDTGQK